MCRCRFTVIHTAMSKRKVSKLSKLLLEYIARKVNHSGNSTQHGRKGTRVTRARIAYATLDSRAGFVCEMRNVTYDCSRVHVVLSRTLPSSDAPAIFFFSGVICIALNIEGLR